MGGISHSTKKKHLEAEITQTELEASDSEMRDAILQPQPHRSPQASTPPARSPSPVPRASSSKVPPRVAEKEANDADDEVSAFPTAEPLRDVDAAVGLKLKQQDENDALEAELGDRFGVVEKTMKVLLEAALKEQRRTEALTSKAEISPEPANHVSNQGAARTPVSNADEAELHLAEEDASDGGSDDKTTNGTRSAERNEVLVSRRP